MTTSKKKTKNATVTTKARVAKRRAKAAPPKAAPAPSPLARTRPPPPRARQQNGQDRRPAEAARRRHLKDLVKATDWQPHSVRGFLSGTIGKKMGTSVESFKSAEGDRSYRLSAK